MMKEMYTELWELITIIETPYIYFFQQTHEVIAVIIISI